MKHARTLMRTVAIGLALSACVAGTGESAHSASSGLLSQFLLGFWHGLIAPLTLIGEIINRIAPDALPWRVRLYEIKAAGAAYDVGFYIALVGGPSLIWSRWPRRS